MASRSEDGERQDAHLAPVCVLKPAGQVLIVHKPRKLQDGLIGGGDTGKVHGNICSLTARSGSTGRRRLRERRLLGRADSAPAEELVFPGSDGVELVDEVPLDGGELPSLVAPLPQLLHHRRYAPTSGHPLRADALHVGFLVHDGGHCFNHVRRLHPAPRSPVANAPPLYRAHARARETEAD
jgi:hypothetical protein